jgi:hypothetical protein
MSRARLGSREPNAGCPYQHAAPSSNTDYTDRRCYERRARAPLAGNRPLSATGLITLGDAIELIAFGGPAPEDADESALAASDAAENKLKFCAFKEELTGWGMWNGRGEFLRIPAGFWLASTLEQLGDRGWLTKPEYP